MKIRVGYGFVVRQINCPAVGKMPYIHTNQQIQVVVK
jgi:hypothetical protein